MTRSEYLKKWREEHVSQRRAYYEKNRETLLAKKRAHYQEKLEEYRKKGREYYQRNRQRMKVARLLGVSLSMIDAEGRVIV